MSEHTFQLNAPFAAAGDQPRAIEQTLQHLQQGEKHHGILGVTGSGKTFTVANIIARYDRPALIVAPNKTLAAQLFTELKEFFRTIMSNFLSVITTTTNPKLT